jgi:hypothetical protein
VKLRYAAGFWLVLAISVVLCWPLAKVFWFHSHEGQEYVARTVEFTTAFRNGVIYPRWMASLYGGYGSPFANFYAPGVYWLGGIFTLVLNSPTVAVKLVVLLSVWLAAGGSFALLYQETKRQDAAFLGAALYTLAPYRVAEVGWRGDLAEHLALGMLALTLFAYRRILYRDNPRSVASAALLAALAHAGMVMSHTLLGLWGTGIAAVLVLLSAYELYRRGAISKALPLALAFVCGLLISAIYTLPAMLEKKWVRTETMVTQSNAPENNPLAIKVLFESGSAHQVGPLLVLAVAVVALGWILRRRPSRAALLWLAGAFALTGLTLPIASPLWAAHVIPFGAFIQFPWRLLGPVCLCAAVAVGLAWAHALPARRVALLASIPLLCAAALLVVPNTAVVPMPPEHVLLSSERIGRLWWRGTVLDEYLPAVVVQPALIPASQVAESTPVVKVQIQKSAWTEHTLSLDASEAADLELKLHSFPGWQVDTREGAQALRVGTSRAGLVSLHVPAAGHYVATVSFGSTSTRRAALGLFWLGLLSVWPLAWFADRYRARRELAQHAVGAL